MPYLTPDEAPDTSTCRALFIPNNEQYLAIVRGALQVLTFPESWTKQGALTPDEAASMFMPMFDKFCFNEGTCRVIGEVITYAGIESPNENWLICDGSSVLIADYPDLWEVIGTTYGGNGINNFALPDLRGKTAEGYDLAHTPLSLPVGNERGSETITLGETEIPSHAHSIADTFSALAVAPGELPVLVPNPLPTLTGFTGGDGAHNNIAPRLAMMFLIVAKDG